VNVTASFEDAKAKVEFDNTKTTKEDIIKAIDTTGYKVINK
jgi:copper chaperone CopZ